MCCQIPVDSWVLVRLPFRRSGFWFIPYPTFAFAGTSGPMAARLALLLAQRQLAEDAGVRIHVHNFAVRLYNSRMTLGRAVLRVGIERALTAHLHVVYLPRSSTKSARSVCEPL